MNTIQHENPRKQSSPFRLIELFSSSLEHFLLLLIVLTIVSSLMVFLSVFHHSNKAPEKIGCIAFKHAQTFLRNVYSNAFL